MELNNRQILLLPLLVWDFLNEAAVDLVLLAAIEQFKYQATNRVYWRNIYERSGTMQKEAAKKTLAKMPPSSLSKHCMCTISIFGVNDHGKVLSVGVLTYTIIYSSSSNTYPINMHTPSLFLVAKQLQKV